MSLIPMLFSDWWEDLDRPHRIWDQHFGTSIDSDDLTDLDSPLSTDVLLYRPHRRARRRYHPFFKSLNRKRGCGVSTVLPNKNKFQVTLDVSQFSPEDINVKVIDQNVVVEAKHGEKEDEHGWVSRQFVRKYIIPSQCDITQIESHLSSDGVLSISVPRKEPLKSEANETIIPIHHTGKPAINNCDDKPNDTLELQKEKPSPQRGQQQQQQQQQQQPQHQHQRGRKGTVKVP
ncbi:Protein lethal(2)essential for life [Habropoda laboriosa]|uniref:Protein lethal(2)essential for life n=1 Tax=Habropoda laboriosa TaxID=597456 RepID=A0A0L7RHA5_9HYME|nr:PREDICTED: protein lethal(2)essential for life-like [Habropoda laboriosa]KOC70255.1 Protein lethal(2)essential for life [Habropoda laboriosa]